jgi:hypothetical protein
MRRQRLELGEIASSKPVAEFGWRPIAAYT